MGSGLEPNASASRLSIAWAVEAESIHVNTGIPLVPLIEFPEFRPSAATLPPVAAFGAPGDCRAFTDASADDSFGIP